MAIFEVTDDSFQAVEPTKFASLGMGERTDIQRLLRDQVEVVAPDVLVISEEFGEWTESRRRIDLLGIDKDANLVVIELKRTDDGGHMELQALRYSAMVSTLTAARAVEILGAYLQGRGRDDDPEQLLLDFLEWPGIDEDSFGQDVRVILVSADFSRELTTTVIWLNEKDLDIRCVRIRPYSHHGRTLIDVQQVIPLAETADYQVQVREKKRQERASRKSNMDLTRYDVTIDGEIHHAQWKRNSILLVVKALVAKGTNVVEMREFFKALGRGKVFYEVPGKIQDPQEFCRLASEQEQLSGAKFNERRWHTGDDDLVICSGNTYAFSNQWGIHWLSFMQELQRRYPQISLDFIPSKIT